jgi:hypothetical protein
VTRPIVKIGSRPMRRCPVPAIETDLPELRARRNAVVNA